MWRIMYYKKTKNMDLGIIKRFCIGEGTSKNLRKLVDKIGENNLKIILTYSNFVYESELGIN